jgi:RNA polymerase sigma-70 factor (ECF subfamily)
MNASRYNYTAIVLPDENHLLQQLAIGDEVAFRKIFDAYRKPVYAYAMHLVKSESLADEIIQDVFLRVWLNKATVAHLGNFKAWLFTIAKNRIFDIMKSRAKEALLKQTLRTPEPSYETENQIRDKEYESLLNDAISQLSPKQQLIYHLSRKNGLKHEEIALRLNISSNTVKTHLVHALRTIKKYLQPHIHAVLACILFYILPF